MSNTFQGYTWDSRTTEGLSIYNATCYRWSRDCFCHRNCLPFWVLDCSFSPGMRYRIGSSHNRWQLRIPGAFHLYPPRIRYWSDTRRAVPYHGSYIMFRGGEAAGLDRFAQNSRHFARFLDPEGIIAALVQEAAQIGETSQDQGFWQAQARLCQLIHALLTSQPIEDNLYRVCKSGQGPSRSDFVVRVRNYLNEHLEGPFRLANVARHVHVSLSTLTHRYRREAGETVLATHNQFRLRRVKSMLLLHEKLDNVAAHLGFSDKHHLSKWFKRMNGISPRHFLQGGEPRGKKGMVWA
ncbi:MAG: helix-turn-helix transcriptional regulator [Verrucomicrobia bacterium]|nr:helix-turn-helix transcriptional regulator [Verrucomicrobiota bacterium]